jgi:hypothetical protein
MKDKIEERPVTKQLLISMLKYMNGDNFNPTTKVSVSDIESIIK